MEALPKINIPEPDSTTPAIIEKSPSNQASPRMWSTNSLNRAFVPSKPTVKEYFSEVYNTLCSQDLDLDGEESKKVKALTAIIFLQYTKLPKLVSDRLFHALQAKPGVEILKDQFVEGFEVLALGNLEKKMKLVFKMLDFDDDGFVSRDDCRILLSHIPSPDAAKLDSPRAMKLNAQQESEQDIEKVLDDYFPPSKGNEAMQFREFYHLALNNVSDIQLSILLYLLENLKIEGKLFRYEKHQNQEDGSARGRPISTGSRDDMHEHSTSGSPRDFASRYKGINMCVPPKVLKKHGVLGDFLFTRPKKRNSFTLMPGQPHPAAMIMGRRKSLTSSPGGLLGIPGASASALFNIQNQAFDLLERAESEQLPEKKEGGDVELEFGDKMEQMLEEAKQNDNYLEIEEDVVYHEGFMYRKLDESKLKKYWYELRGSELYVFRKQKDTKHKQMLLLGLNVHLVEEPSILKTEDNREVLSFSMMFGKKRREFFLVNRKELDGWMKALKLAIDKPSIHSKYEIDKFLGKGKFGNVHLAINHKTKEEVAAKIINKGKMSKEELNSLTYEIDILKLCQHKYIIELKDLFEDQFKYYLVQEYLPGGSLYDYLHARKGHAIHEKVIRQMTRQIAEAILYLKNHGIIHRDLKPDNIMLQAQIGPKDNDAVPHLKVVDFGLSIILGPKQKSKDPFGTLTYVAPEILLAKAYDCKVDVYSIGVILYEFMAKRVPFSDRDQNVLLEMIIEDKPDFKKKEITHYSEGCQKLAKALLTKDPKTRPSIEQVLEDKWLMDG